MSLRLFGAKWRGRFEIGRHGLPDYAWHASNNADGFLVIYMCSGARFFVNWRSGSSRSCSQAFPKFEDAVEHAADTFRWLPEDRLDRLDRVDPSAPRFFQCQV